MPEMHQTRYLAGRLSGAQLADTLYLPQHVELTGDAVILVRYLIFEGNEVLIKGDHYLALYPANDVGVLGTTLRRRKRRGRIQSGNLEPEIEIPETRPPVKPGHITIDTSGTSQLPTRSSGPTFRVTEAS